MTTDDLLDLRVQRLGKLLAGSGPAPAHGRDVFCETGAFLDVVVDPELGWVEPTSLVFSPSGDEPIVGHPTDGAPASVVAYSGSLAPGAEVSLDDRFYLSVVEYAVSPYVPVVGPTLVRIVGDDDIGAFAADADLAHRNGRFPEVLVHPAVELADPCALGLEPGCPLGALPRAFVGADGEVAAAVGGAPLAGVGDGIEVALLALRARPGCGERCLGEVVSAGAVAELHEGRAWLAGYLSALAGLRALAVAGHRDIRVSGFGGRLARSFDGEAHRASERVVVFSNGSSSFLRDRRGRMFGVGHDAALVVEALEVTGSVDAAVDAFSTERGLRRDVVEGQLVAAVESLAARGLTELSQAS